MATKIEFDEAELIFGCKHCKKKPMLSSYMMQDHRPHVSYTCCRLGRRSQSAQEAAHYWNETNRESGVLYKKNNITKEWEVVTNEQT